MTKQRSPTWGSFAARLLVPGHMKREICIRSLVICRSRGPYMQRFANATPRVRSDEVDIDQLLIHASLLHLNFAWTSICATRSRKRATLVSYLRDLRSWNLTGFSWFYFILILVFFFKPKSTLRLSELFVMDESRRYLIFVRLRFLWWSYQKR